MKFIPVKLNPKTGKLEQGRKYNSLKKAVKKEMKLRDKGYQVVMMVSEDGKRWSSINTEVL